MHILLLTVEYTPELSGGVGTHAEELAAGLTELGNDVTVIGCAPREASIVRNGRLTVHLIEPPTSGRLSERSIANDIAAFNEAVVAYGSCDELRQNRPAVIQCCNWLTYTAACELSHVLSAPIVCSMHYVSDPIERWWGQEPDPHIVARERELLKDRINFISVSHSLSAILKEHYAVPGDLIHTVHNGIRCDAFQRRNEVPDSSIEELRYSICPENNPIVLFAGRIHPQKGIGALLDSASQVLEAYPDVLYLIVGEPDSRESSTRFQETLQAKPFLRKHVRVLGKVRRKELALLYRVANLALIPSVYEACCYAALEAMACAVPVIATDAGGIPEIVAQGQTGLLVPVQKNAETSHVVDVDALSFATLQLLNDTSLAHNLGHCGQQRVREQFTVEAMARATEQVYKLVADPVRSNI